MPLYSINSHQIHSFLQPSPPTPCHQTTSTTLNHREHGSRAQVARTTEYHRLQVDPRPLIMNSTDNLYRKAFCMQLIRFLNTAVFYNNHGLPFVILCDVSRCIKHTRKLIPFYPIINKLVNHLT